MCAFAKVSQCKHLKLLTCASPSTPASGAADASATHQSLRWLLRVVRMTRVYARASPATAERFCAIRSRQRSSDSCQAGKLTPNIRSALARMSTQGLQRALLRPQIREMMRQLWQV